MSNAHKVRRLIREKINNQPLLITENNLKSVVDYLETRDATSSIDEPQSNEKVVSDNIAIVPIKGNLTYEKTFLSALCGMTSYQQLSEDIDTVLSLGIKTIVLMADSGGGEAYAMMSTADSIRKRVTANGARLITYVDGISASACFGLTAISDEIILHPDASIGSVGVVVRLVNDKEHQKKEGYETTYITSAKSKVPFDDEGNFKEDFIKDIQSNVDDLHIKFATHIANYRTMSLEDVNGTNAKVFNSKEAISLGFADKVMDHDEFQEYLVKIEENGFTKNTRDYTKPKEENKMSQEGLQAQLDSTIVEKEQALSQLAELQTQLESESNVVKELNSQVEGLNKLLSDIETEGKNKELAARKEKLKEVLAEDQVDTLFEAVKGLDEASFNAVLGGYKAQAAALETSELFQEEGLDAELGKTDEELSSVMKLIQQNKKGQ